MVVLVNQREHALKQAHPLFIVYKLDSRHAVEAVHRGLIHVHIVAGAHLEVLHHTVVAPAAHLDAVRVLVVPDEEHRPLQDAVIVHHEGFHRAYRLNTYLAVLVGINHLRDSAEDTGILRQLRHIVLQAVPGVERLQPVIHRIVRARHSRGNAREETCHRVYDVFGEVHAQAVVGLVFGLLRHVVYLVLVLVSLLQLLQPGGHFRLVLRDQVFQQVIVHLCAGWHRDDFGRRQRALAVVCPEVAVGGKHFGHHMPPLYP